MFGIGVVVEANKVALMISSSCSVKLAAEEIRSMPEMRGTAKAFFILTILGSKQLAEVKVALLASQRQGEGFSILPFEA